MDVPRQTETRKVDGSTPSLATITSHLPSLWRNCPSLSGARRLFRLPSHVLAILDVYQTMERKKPFESIVTAHARTVLRVCRVVVGVHDADDAWSETFLAAMRAYPELPADANIEAWLVTIAHRKSVDIIRARQRHAIPVDEVPEQPSALNVPESDHNDLWDAVQALPPKQRQAIAYHYLVGLPYAEIAEILGGTTDAARRAASDGMKRLRITYPQAVTEGAIR